MSGVFKLPFRVAAQHLTWLDSTEFAYESENLSG
jgi:hypothetical protein